MLSIIRRVRKRTRLFLVWVRTLNNQHNRIVVIGGGLAGCMAATAAARSGVRCTLVEKCGFLGGWATAALVNPFMSYRASDGVQLVAGLFEELLLRLRKRGGLLGTSFDSETMKHVLQDMVIEAGVELRLHTRFISAEYGGNGRIIATFGGKSGTYTIDCARLIDCSGDGDAAASLGAEYEMGDENGLCQALTLMFDMGGVDLVKALTYVRDHPDQMRFPQLSPDADPSKLVEGAVAVAGYYDLVAQARGRGDYDVPGDLIFYISRPRKGEVVFNTTHIGGVNPLDSRDLTRAEVECRRQMMSIVEFVRKYVPGFEDAYLIRSADHVGVRESRRILGDYVFSADDVRAGRKFPDAICRLAYPVDVHSGRGKGYTRGEEYGGNVAPPPGDWYEIPYGCLLPRGLENVLTAGRCVSSTHEGHGAIRIMPCCAAMGHAAGIAAAISVKQNLSPREIAVSELLGELRNQGALV